ncbi:MAG TPA: suppressor of fused domain protein [Streptosporangiaceae bacterium]|nr:suppressor of fused domain protein [Streptosporangiaceae bacterium]
MPTLRRESAGSLQPRTLLESENPYESRRLTVEYDGVTTAAYLHDGPTTVAATWIANHVPAPASTDVARIESGQAPIMPSGHTKLPEGRAPIEPGTLEPLWFEEGDGVAVLENGKLLAVIPGWSDASRGMPGYSRDVVGQTPFGWSLDDAMEGLGPRVERARAYWRWRGHERSWGVFQQGVLGHLTDRLGAGEHYWDASQGKQPTAGISERPPTADRPYTVLSTVGMSCQRMPVVERLVQDPGQYARIELAMATTMPAALAARVFLWLAPYPWRAVTWFGPGHSVRWYHEPSTFPLGEGHEAVLLLDEPGGLLGPEPPDLSGYSFGGDPVRWLWVVPITETERLLAKEEGSASLITSLASEGRSWVIPGRDEAAGQGNEDPA